MIRLEDVALAPGGEPLLSGVTWHIRPADKVGLVGRNGTGKTTLLRAIVGELGVDAGRVSLRGGLRLGWLPQTAVSGSTRSVWDEARSGMTRIAALREQVEAAQRAVEAGEPGAIERLDRASEAFRLAGGYAEDEKVGEVLHGLGFGPDRWHDGCHTFSGGWQMRIALARMLLSEPDVALLDEPTNHLDLQARSWLADHLARVPWAFVVVSHDRWLLDRAVQSVAEVRRGRLHLFRGNWSAWLTEREARAAQQQAAYDKQQAEIAKLERFVERFGAKATKASQANARKKQLEKMDRVEAPEADAPLPRFHLPEAPPSGHEAVVLQGVHVGYDSEPVLRGVDFTLERGSRVAVLGPNGCGKSTLLHALSGRLRPSAGRRRVDDRARIGVFSQDLAAELPAEPTAAEWVEAQAPMVAPQRVRTVLGALGLSGDAALRPIGQLSGGERARVALAALAIRPYNVLLLDEPTNHLDVETVEVLVRALSSFEGALLLVSHDRYVVERLATHVAHVRNGSVDVRLGCRPEDLAPGGPPETRAEGPSSGAEAYEARKKRARERQRLERRVEELQREIEQAESEVARLDALLIEVATDYARATELADQRAAVEQRMDDLFAEWEAADAQLRS